MPASITIPLLAAALTMAVTAIVAAPAAWLSGWLAPPGPVRLVEPAGTLWRGSTLIAVSDGQQALLLPGRVTWRIDPGALLAGRLGVTLTHPLAADAVQISGDRHGVDLAAGSARLPAAWLVLFGAPFNTLRPGGEVLITWSDLSLGNATLSGRIEAQWRDAQSALSPVAPLGSFRLVASGAGTTGDLVLSTLSGPLLLEGRGRMADRVVRFNGTADAEPAMRPRLNALLGILGARAGDHVTLNWALQI